MRSTLLLRAHRALLAVCAGFVLLPAPLVPLDLPLGWDEIVYAGRFTSYAQGLDVPFEAPRTRGVPALMVPVAAWSDDVVLLRVWLSLLAGVALYVGYAPWLRVLRARPYVVPLAAAGYGSLWFTLFYVGSAMPNHYTAMGATATVGWFLRHVEARRDGRARWGGRARREGRAQRDARREGRAQRGARREGRRDARRGRGFGAWRGASLRALAGLASGLALATLMRPNDAAWIAAPLVLAVLVHRPWRRLAPLAAIAVGVLAGVAPWVVESELRFGGVAERLALATDQQGGLRLRFNLPAVINALDGPLLCRPCTPGGPSLPTALWWYVLPLLVIAGVRLVLRGQVWGCGRTGAGAGPGARVAGGVDEADDADEADGVNGVNSADGAEVPVAAVVLPVVVAGSAAVTYLFLLDYSAARFLLPSYALLALPAALAVRALWGAARSRGRGAVAVLAFVLAGHLAAQLVVARAHVGIQTEARGDWNRIAAALREAGVGRGCVLDGNSMLIPVAYTAGCLPAMQLPGRAPDAWVLRKAEPPDDARELRVIPVPGTYNKGWQIAVPLR